ncbi:MAG: MerR family transcriptional regulator [Candidatus Aminicenantes bacterium]|nr:MerR family transcriptional regulator [Candidatus Aminicenantes bacterium]
MELKIPDKLTFKRNEVTRLTRLDGKVIDYWEKEFGGLKPVVNKFGEKFYTKKDVEIILNIKRMLIGEKRNKEDIKKIINEDYAEPVEKEKNNRNTLKLVRKGLQEILTILDKHGK